ncbi:MAG: TRAP transporter small permease subunit, partial [Thermoanaerobaculia bacterium]
MSLKGAFWRLEGGLAGLSLVLMAILPLAEAGLRGIFGIGIPGSLPFVQHLTLWVTFLGAALASRADKLLTLATGEFLPEGRWREAAKIGANTIAAAITALLARAAWDLVVIERQAGTEVAAGFPTWVAQVVM